ncbi:GNAT family N-acetyltransferase [Pseudomonas guariconensis]|uniref:GNAT family N-acetyltransferase n=1 Tax=Pseudomonas guariconensis TaxID=1288410 RepID=UPI003906A7E3
MPISLFEKFPPPRPVNDQVRTMAGEYVTDLGKLAIPSSNRLYEYQQWVQSVEVDLFLELIGENHEAPVEALIAFDDTRPDLVVGFLIYSPVASDPGACGVSYMAVRKSHRGKGLGRSLITQMVARYPHAELTCPVGLVGFYEKLGFNVLDVDETQVVMNTRSASSKGQMAVLNVSIIHSSAQAQSYQRQLEQRWGRDAMAESVFLLDQHVQDLSRRAASFVRDRLGK